MKKLIIGLSLLTFSYCSSSPPVSEFTSINVNKVYICVSRSAKVYHSNKDCSGLRHCTHEIREITESDAIDEYHRRKCHICY